MKIAQANTAIFVQCEQRSPLPIFKKKYNGTHPILLIIQSSDMQRATRWAKEMHKQFDLHTLALKEINDAVISSYIMENAIQSVLILQLLTTKEPIRIVTNKHYVQQFLIRYPL